jgi:carbon storage regulator CsrA
MRNQNYPGNLDEDCGFLVLSLKPGGSLLIGDNIKVTALPNARGRQVRLAIEAPRSVNIVRSELLERDQ